jgi:RNA polymerase sigma-70 factor (ECF subfamily)
MSAETIHNELKLLAQIAQGDEIAFRLIFDQYNKKFFGAALKMTRSADVAEEIVQEIFVTLWIKRSCLASAQHPSSYLFTIAYNCINNHFRKLAGEKMARQNVFQERYEEQSLAEELLIEKERNETLEKIISDLPPRQQVVFLMSKREDLSRFEIAKRLNISSNTVRNHLQEAVKVIRLKFSKRM